MSSLFRSHAYLFGPAVTGRGTGMKTGNARADPLRKQLCRIANNSGIMHFLYLQYSDRDFAGSRTIWRISISNPDAIELQTYLSQCALGNQPSFEALYKRVSPQLYAVALKSLRRADWAEEILQESFIRIWHNAARYDSTLSAPMTWMTNITRNLAIDLLRRRREESLPDSDSQAGDERPDPDAGPFDLLSTAQDKQALTRCLDTLDGKQRQSIVITYFQGLSNTELAAQMREPLGSIKSWIRRGMERLRSCLES
jgi:RNA polymerase sigma factor (sigma-70 family)